MQCYGLMNIIIYTQEYFTELETYTVLKDARLSDALDALKDLRFITNCTERMFQMRQKLRLQREVDLVVAQNSNFHRTLSELPFTVSFLNFFPVVCINFFRIYLIKQSAYKAILSMRKKKIHVQLLQFLHVTAKY